MLERTLCVGLLLAIGCDDSMEAAPAGAAGAPGEVAEPGGGGAEADAGDAVEEGASEPPTLASGGRAAESTDAGTTTGIESAMGTGTTGSTVLINPTGSSSGYGRGSGAFSGKGRRVPRVRQAKASVDGAMDKDLIRRIVRAHINDVRSCYKRGLTKNPNLMGRVAVKFTIAGGGAVESAEVAESSVSDVDVGTCMAKAVRRWKFPKSKDGKSVSVVYPFTLSPG